MRSFIFVQVLKTYSREVYMIYFLDCNDSFCFIDCTVITKTFTRNLNWQLVRVSIFMYYVWKLNKRRKKNKRSTKKTVCTFGLQPESRSVMIVTYSLTTTTTTTSTSIKHGCLRQTFCYSDQAMFDSSPFYTSIRCL